MSGRPRPKKGRSAPWSLSKFISFALIFLILVTAGLSSFFVLLRTPGLGVQDQPRITKLIYPTVGNPAIVRAGTDFTIEYDPRHGDFENPLGKLDEFRVSAATSNDEHPVEKDLPVVSSAVGFSTHWPELASDPKVDRRIYLLTVKVPDSAPRDLYDLTVRARSGRGAEWVEDSQPHALQAVDDYKDDFTFIQMTDIHVWGPEIYYPSCTYQERSARPNGKDPGRRGALYFQKAIDQVNLLRPDFVIFSGDYMFGQRYFEQDNGRPWGETTEYQYEMLWFYDEMMRLDVPVFMSIGNHDGYNEADQGAHEDWFTNWKILFGPLYYSYDYGAYHFQSLNTMDWAPGQRVMNDWFDIMLQPAKYKGELMGGGDRLSPGVTEERLAAIDESKLTGQLAWARDDLRSSQGAKMRVCVMHHDPWKTDGSGEMWGVPGKKAGILKWFKNVANELLKMGDGQGRLAIIKLMKEYRVALEISGHDHSDYVGSTEWDGGGGELHFVNTTSTQFNSSLPEAKYPGYRKVHVSNGEVKSFNYAEPKWSYPFWEGSVINGDTDPSKLTKPAVRWSLEPAGGGATETTLSIENTLDSPLQGIGAEVRAPRLSDGYYYEAVDGSIAAAREEPGAKPAGMVYTLVTDVGPRESRKAVLVKSAAPDTLPPTGSVTIGDDSGVTGSLATTLNFTVSDEGSGVGEVMVSNDPGFKGAQWQPIRASAPWDLADGAAGTRTVYVRYRDRAMPGNESAVASAVVAYLPAP